MSGKILLYIPSVAKVVGGGVATQAQMTAKYAQNGSKEIVLYNPWLEYDWSEFSAVHIFRADYETHNFAKVVAEKGIPIILSSIFFSSHSPSRIRALTGGLNQFRKLFSGVRSDFDFVKEVCDLATIILPNTQEEANLLSASFGIESSKFRVVPNGVSTEFYMADRDLFYKEFGLRDFTLTVANLGFKRKNMLGALKALKSSSVTYVIIGPLYDNDYGIACKEIIDSCDNIHYLGAMANDSPLLASAYANAKVFLLPSLFETPGIAAMEAALAGAEVVITQNGGTKEYFGEYAHYIDPKSQSSIREAVKIANSSTPLSPQKHILKNYTWERVGEITANIYDGFL